METSTGRSLGPSLLQGLPPLYIIEANTLSTSSCKQAISSRIVARFTDSCNERHRCVAFDVRATFVVKLGGACVDAYSCIAAVSCIVHVYYSAFEVHLSGPGNVMDLCSHSDSVSMVWWFKSWRHTVPRVPALPCFQPRPFLYFDTSDSRFALPTGSLST